MQKTDPFREQSHARAAAVRNPTLERLRSRALGKTPESAVKPTETVPEALAGSNPKPLVR